MDFNAGFPFQDEAKTFDTVGRGSVGGGSFSVLFTRDALLEVFRRNLGYFVVGRHTGFAVYFFPGMMAIILFLAATRDRAMWQWLTLGAGVGTAVALLLYMPFTWSGGGGPVGNRYFLGTYGIFLFLVPPLQTAVAGLADAGDQRSVRHADRVEPVLRLDPSVRAQQVGPVPPVADRVDDGQRPADQLAAGPDAPAARRDAADLRVFHRRQHLQPRGRRVLGEGRVDRGPPAARADCARGAGRRRPGSALAANREAHGHSRDRATAESRHR